MKIVPNEKFIINNFNKTLELVKNNVKDKNLTLMLEEIGDRYATCPATSSKEYYSCFPGGLAYHNLYTYFWMIKFSDLMTSGKYSKDTILKLAILHDIGKVGTRKKDYFIPQDSDWHRDRGIYYKVNEELPYMKVRQRSLCLAQEFGISLTEEEYIAIAPKEGSSFFRFNEDTLCLVLDHAVTWATKLEKQNVVVRS